MAYYLKLLMLILAIYLLILRNPVILNPNTESMDLPMAIAYIQNPNNEIWENYKNNDPFAFSYPNKTFRPKWFALALPFPMLCFYPFVKIFGVGSISVSAYCLFFSVLSVILMFFVAYKMFDKWIALTSCFFLISSISWLIHSKCGIQHPPAVCLMIGIIYFLWSYCETFNPEHIFAISILITFSYLSGWILFPLSCLIIATSIIIFNKKSISKIGLFVIAIIPLLLISNICFTSIYSVFTHYSILEINKSVLDGYLSRFMQGSVPAENLSTLNRIIYEIKSIFINMTAIDHPDKYLENVPSIPYVFTFFFIPGIYYARKQFILIVWLFIVLGILGTIYLYSGRYCLLALPCMAIIASIGYANIFSFSPKSNILFFIIMSATMYVENYQYYQLFTLKSSTNFERDRMRGHYEFSQWLKSHYDTKTTLVVLGDPINTSEWQLMFHNMDNPYRFEYWNGTPKNKGTTVYVFSKNTLINNGVIPDFTYSYNGNNLFYAFVSKQ